MGKATVVGWKVVDRTTGKVLHPWTEHLDSAIQAKRRKGENAEVVREARESSARVR